ncbi:MAG: methylated-DNA--[protein]-cysteine S-methyltransferase [Methanobacteriota archaeon]|nr:MAG: methylated-DNA--[protein]-cysteine S-methyltransferase [Euryarchaeota archaeon]
MNTHKKRRIRIEAKVVELLLVLDTPRANHSHLWTRKILTKSYKDFVSSKEKSILIVGILLGMKEGDLVSKVLKTQFGRIDLRASDHGLFELSLNGRLRKGIGDNRLLDKVRMDLERYFTGEPVDFSDLKLDTFGYTPFERDVLAATKQIPYGKTKSYKDIAEEIGRPKAFRAVGNALGKNRTAIVVPCQRVISSGGDLGGFGAGIEWKKRLLRLEGIL